MNPAGPNAADILRGGWRCAGCGQVHEGPIDLASFAPDPWEGRNVREENGAVHLDGDFLSEDFCVMGGRYFFVRSVLEIPIQGFSTSFGFGCWSTLSRENFEKYLDGFDTGNFADWGPWTGWLSNQLYDYIGAEPEGVWVYPQADRQRPLLIMQDATHPLGIDQANGITPERVLAIFDHYGHRPER